MPDEPQTAPPYPAGCGVVDTRDDRTGFVKGVKAGRLYLRAPGGGAEWQALPVHVRPASESEALSARVADQNAQSSGYRYGGRPPVW